MVDSNIHCTMQVGSNGKALACGAKGPEIESRQCQSLGVFEIPFDKELTANCLIETRTKLRELIHAVMG